MARPPIPRYGIAEWFGHDITAMTPAQRQHFGRLAVQARPKWRHFQCACLSVPGDIDTWGEVQQGQRCLQYSPIFSG